MGDGKVDPPDGEPARGHDVFISYSRADRAAVVALTRGLGDRGKRAWVDLEDIPPSAEWMAEIRAAIDSSDGYVVVVSPDLARSKVCADELEHARAAGKRVVPILVRRTDPGSVPEALAALNWIDATDGVSDATLDRVVQALEADLGHVRSHTRLLVRATEWDAHHRDRSFLLRGRDLTDAEAWLGAGQAKEPPPTATQTAFVLASRKAASRRQRTVIGAVAIALAVSLVLSVVAVIQRGAALEQKAAAEREAGRSLSRQLVVQSSALLEEDLDVAALLSIEAFRAAPTPEARTALASSAWATRLLRTTLRTEAGRVASALSPDGSTIATVGADALNLWDFATGALEASFPYEKKLRAVTFSPDGQLVAAGSGGVVPVWDVATAQLVAELPQTGWVRAVAFSPDGGTLASGGNGRTVTLWDRTTWAPILGFEQHRGFVMSIAFSPDGRTIASSDNWSKVRIWNVGDGRQLQSFRPPGWWIFDVAFSPDGRTVAAGTFDGVVWLWDVAARKLTAELRTPAGYVTSLAFRPDGHVLALGTSSGTSELWDLATLARIGTISLQSDWVRSLTYTPDAGTLVSSADDGEVALVDVGLERRVVVPGAEALGAYATTFDPAGTTVAWAGHPAHATILDLRWERILQLPIDRNEYRWLNTIAFDPSGTRVVVGGSGGPAQIWDTATGTMKGELPGSDGSLSALFGVDGSTVMTGSTRGVLGFWDAGDLRPLAEEALGGTAGLSLSLGPDGRTLTVGTGESVLTLNVPSHGQVSELTDHPGWLVASAPVGEVTAVALRLGAVVELWEVGSGRLLGLLPGGATAASVAFSPDGRLLAVGDHEGSVTLWLVATRQALARFQPGGDGEVAAVAFSPDGHLLSTGSAAAGMALWAVPDLTGDPADIVADLCTKVRRNLSRSEWEQYLPSRPYHLTCPGLDPGADA